MKYEIHVNQRAIIENQLDIDLVDGAIMDFCRFFSGSNSCRFIVEDGKRYYWFSHKNICDQLPILRLKPDSAYRRMKALCEKSFLKAHPENKRLNASWYALEPLSDLLFTTIGAKSEGTDINPKVDPKRDEKPAEPSDENPNPIGFSSVPPSDQNPMYKEDKDYKEDNKQQQTKSEIDVAAVDPEFESVKAKINEVRERVKKASQFKTNVCIPLRLKPEYYDLLSAAFFDEQIGFAQTGIEIDYKGLQKHLKAWITKQVELGGRSRYHADFKPISPQQHNYPGAQSTNSAPLVTAQFTSATPD